MSIKYHYTNLNGLFNILNYQTLRFGNVNMMNDPNELEMGKSFLICYLQDKYNTNHFDRRTIEGLTNPSSNVDSYIFCMSSVPEDLNQWRVYADNGNGVQLSINTDSLNKYVNHYLESSMGQACKEGLRIPYRSDELEKCHYLSLSTNTGKLVVNECESKNTLYKELDDAWEKYGLDDYFDFYGEVLVTKNIKDQLEGRPITPERLKRTTECSFTLEVILKRIYAIIKEESYKVENEFRNVIYADRSLLSMPGENEFKDDGLCLKDIFSYYTNGYGISSCIDVPINNNLDYGHVIEEIKLGCNANKTNARAIDDMLKYKWKRFHTPITYSSILFR
ncbi:DUF2971 domain-containing protein [Vibrio vulnificus]|nr:DUF2971 domain-containing protein [Vibrio vulnificus]EHI9279586.1 DUF2971 domain-containing protein [Vibrio vulnificus]EIJ0944078.1 DUF2971 domain-containing protein [Vibrio vulnificus]EJE8540533.1 DUF2971 domain-containing protein [Vibrio vulnificus]EKA7343398.1 DUF2971 domain-containing protein [Vibrio vulnificus]